MNQHQTVPSGKEKSSEIITKETPKATTANTEVDIFKRVIGTPDDLLLACKIAAGKGHKRVIATKDLVTYMLNNEPGYSVMVSGVEVVVEGFEEQADRDKAKTMEQVNFGKV